MDRRRIALLSIVLIGVLLATAGCLGGERNENGSSDDASASVGSPNGSQAPWDGARRLELVRFHVGVNHVEGSEGSCAEGSTGPQLDRTGEPVLNGTDHLEVTAKAAESYAGRLQIGYVLDSNSADHAGQVNKTITWLEPIPAGENETRKVQVGADQTEPPNSSTRWDFYYRFQPPEGERECYTGAGAGEISIRIDAVRSPR